MCVCVCRLNMVIPNILWRWRWMCDSKQHEQYSIGGKRFYSSHNVLTPSPRLCGNNVINWAEYILMVATTALCRLGVSNVQAHTHTHPYTQTNTTMPSLQSMTISDGQHRFHTANQTLCSLVAIELLSFCGIADSLSETNIFLTVCWIHTLNRKYRFVWNGMFYICAYCWNARTELLVSSAVAMFFLLTLKRITLLVWWLFERQLDIDARIVKLDLTCKNVRLVEI